MGRIQKKKDPVKKKARQQASAVARAATSSAGSSSGSSKPVQAVKKSAGLEKAKPVAQDPNFIQKSIQFVREVKIELKKVTWPTRKQTMGSTMVVIVLVLIISLFLGLVDVSLSSLIQMVLP